MKPKKIFNPTGNDKPESRSIINGNTTNLMQLNRPKYRWAVPLYKQMLHNFWVPEKIDLTDDFVSFKKLSQPEQNAYRNILSFLTFLDSIQTTNIPNFSAWITAPEIILCLTTHAFQEAVHAQSYQYMIETLFPVSERDQIYDIWRDDPILLERNQTIASVYQDFLDNPTEHNFIRSLIANYILEGIYFVNGFYFFYNLASRHLMLRSAEIIKYIHRDELLHLSLFQHILQELLTPAQLEPMLVPMMTKAVEQEINWSLHIFSDNIPGVSAVSVRHFTCFLANQRLRALHIPPLYPNLENPYPHLERYANVNQSQVFANFFEGTVTEYQLSSSVTGWDEL